MIRPTRAFVVGTGILLLALGTQLLAKPQASAQWLPDRNYTEGPGFRVGNLELHPGIAVRGGWDSNVFRTPGNAAFPEEDSGILAITPHLNLTTLSPQRLRQGEDAAGAAAAPLPPPVAFGLGLSATYFHFFLDRAPKNVEVDFDANLRVLPERKIGFDVGALYARNSRAFTRNVDGENNTYAFDRVRPSLILRGQSRGGVLKGTVGFAPNIIYYEDIVFRYLTQNQYEVPATLAWKFLPNTALLYDGAFAFTDYYKPQTRATVLVSDSKRFQTRLGVNGAITPKLGARALIGYAAVLLDRGVLDDHEDAVAEAALTYAWSLKDSAEIGYQRTVDLSNLGGWTQVDRGYAKASMLFAGMFALALEVGAGKANYGRLLDPNSDPLGQGGDESREDIRVDAGVHAEYRATNWLAIMADFSTLAALTDFEYAGTVMLPPFPGEFKTFQVFGGVRAHY